MILECVETEGFSQLSYLLADEEARVAAVIDPRRDVEVYLDLAERRGVRITHILETHSHEDFVSGSRELSARTAAPIYTGPNPDIHFDRRTLNDGDVVHIGRVTLRALHTPGHAPEHMCYVASGGKDAMAPWGVFSGDLLLPGDVGRTDVAGHDHIEAHTRELYHSIHDQLLMLGDEIEVFPLHGRGSPSGTDIGDRKTTTLGYERRNNPKLQVADEDEFVRKEVASLDPVPLYFPIVRNRNASGPNILGRMPHVLWLDPATFEAEKGKNETVVLDTRPIEAFGGAHIPDALSIALRRAFPIWVGWMVRPHQHILLVLNDDAHLPIVCKQLLQAGFDRIGGALSRGMEAWFSAGLPMDMVLQMSAHELKSQIYDADTDYGMQVVDVRGDREWREGHLPSARHIGLPRLLHHLPALRADRPVVVYCSSGFRGSIAASVLQQHGFRQVYNVPGGITAWRAAGYPVEHSAKEPRAQRA